jgi:hypothetical protein
MMAQQRTNTAIAERAKAQDTTPPPPKPSLSAK